ncbi:DUF3108 domain-containing protein [Aureimonas sp. Leaf324]|uniref:DUF3108 domain-containing protein n=1 Tax=Aureimonas sp. Leaf324 TaxID=1736336 RepID=UPI0006FF3111|nr:DUF3108 domain-containing protein [Aureimonas sp. Leaf324]KQQ79806.1 hypothetical protein ASF65_12320 [Aureimonas sp. Leaf324]
MLRAATGLFASALLALAAPAGAEAAPLRTVYTISLIGLPVGRAEFRTTIDARRFKVEGTLSSAGLAELVSSTRGTSSVSGRIAGRRLLADRYALAYTSDGKSWASDLSLRSGSVVSAKVAPPARNPAPADFVPVRRAQLTSVVDPLSGLMIAPGKPGDLCRRTLNVYDGWSRIDLPLSPAGTERVRTDGFDGEAVVCTTTVRPVGGYRTSSNGLRFLRGKVIRLWFAPIGDTGVYAPVRVCIPTEVGPLSLTASTFAKP